MLTMELEELKEIDKKELDRITTISKKHENDKKNGHKYFLQRF